MNPKFGALLATLLLVSSASLAAEVPSGLSSAGDPDPSPSVLHGLSVRFSPALFQVEDADFDYPLFTSHFGAGGSYPLASFLELGVWGEYQSAKLGLYDLGMRDAYSYGVTVMLLPPSLSDTWQFGFRPGAYFTSWGMTKFAPRGRFGEGSEAADASYAYRRDSGRGLAVEFMAVARHYLHLGSWGRRLSFEEAVGFRGFGETIEKSPLASGQRARLSSDTVFAVRGEISVGYHF